MSLTARTVLLLLWLALSVAIWNVIFDLYVSRGAREYLQLQAEFQLGLGPEPAMAEVMRRNTRDGLWGATLWGGLVLVAGIAASIAARPRTSK